MTVLSAGPLPEVCGQALPDGVNGSKPYRLEVPSRLPKGHYSGAGQFISTGSRAEEMVFEPGSFVEDVWIRPFATRISAKGVHFKNLVLSLSGIIDADFEDCTFDGLILSTYPSYMVYSTAGVKIIQVYGSDSSKAVRLKNCVVAHAHLPPPALCNLRIKGTTFYRSSFESNRGIALAENGGRAYEDCLFRDCHLHDSLVLATTQNCSFRGCDSFGVLSSRLGESLVAPLVVTLDWKECEPLALPNKGNVKISFDKQDLPSPGSTLAHEWVGGSLISPIGRDVKAEAQRKFADASGAQPQQFGGSGPLASTPVSGSPPASSRLTPASATLPMSGDPGKSLKLRQTHVNGLLVTPLPSGGESGSSSRMNLTAVSTGRAGFEIGFAQEVGEMMTTALGEVKKFINVRHGTWPEGYEVEIAFEEKYSGKDGPSAAVACALLLESAITGKELAGDFAVTGDMNADGSVQPIGGLRAKIRGAANSGCGLVLAPNGNEGDLQDMLLLDGPTPLVKTMVFGIGHFDEALALAGAERMGGLGEAVEDFRKMRDVLLKDPRMMVPVLRSVHTPPRLRSILAKAPHCLSAKFLLMFAEGRLPKQLTLGGSLEAAQNRAEGLVNAINNDASGGIDALQGDEVGAMISRLSKLRPIMDTRIHPYADAVVDYGRVVREALLNPIKSGSRYEAFIRDLNLKASAAKAAHDRIVSDPAIREELGL